MSTLHDEFYYPKETDDASKRLMFVSEHLEQVTMCLSCKHYYAGRCPEEADAERPCNSHIHVANLMAENLTDDLKQMESAITRVKDLEAFLENSRNED